MIEADNGLRSARLIRDHLQEAHAADLGKLSDADLEKNDLYICRQCDDKLFVTLNAITKHIRSNHCESRELANVELVEAVFFQDLQGTFTSEWADALDFLSTLKLSPPSF